jgi:type II secretory pathway component PulF
MAALPGFNRMHVAITKAGASTTEGGLEGNFYALAKRLQSSSLLMRKLIGNLIYPGVMLMGTVSVACYISIGIVPKFSVLYKDMGADLPWITRVVQEFGKLVVDHGATAGASVVAALIAGSILIKKIAHTRLADRALLSIPVIGKVIGKLALMRALQVYSLASKAGLPASDIYSLAGEAADNCIVKEFFDAVYSRVQLGTPPETAMAREWPRLGAEGIILAGKISIGNKSGKTSVLIDTLAADYQSSAETTMTLFPQLFSLPVMVLMAGILIPTVLALTLPIPTLIARQLETMAKQ